jgi:hypothetical protein
MYRLAVLFTPVLFLVGCASGSVTGGGSTPKGLSSVLKVTPERGKLKARLELTNSSSSEVVVSGLNPRNFHVETVDGKVMEFKGKSGEAEALHVAPGQTVETGFNIQDNYPFWDRRTKYKIWYESPNLKTNAVQVWF